MVNIEATGHHYSHVTGLVWFHCCTPLLHTELILVVSDLFPSADCVAIVVSDSINTVGEVELTARARWQLWLDASAGQILCLIFRLETNTIVHSTWHRLESQCWVSGSWRQGRGGGGRTWWVLILKPENQKMSKYCSLSGPGLWLTEGMTVCNVCTTADIDIQRGKQLKPSDVTQLPAKYCK